MHKWRGAYTQEMAVESSLTTRNGNSDKKRRGMVSISAPTRMKEQMNLVLNSGGNPPPVVDFGSNAKGGGGIPPLCGRFQQQWKWWRSNCSSCH